MTSNFPAVNEIYADLQSVIEKLLALDAAVIESANLVPMMQAVRSIAAYSGAIAAQIDLRAVGNGELIPGVVVKDAVVHRKWHNQEAAEQLAREQFGDEAFVTSLKSPAQIEKLKDGKTFVAVASYKPDAPKKAVY